MKNRHSSEGNGHLLKYRLKSTCAAFCLLMTSGGFAVAQESVEVEADEEKRAILDTVVVSARRREESLNEVPSSVVALGEAQLENLGVIDVTDIGTSVPSLTIQNNVGGYRSTLAIFIRGIGNTNGGGGGALQAAGSAMYIDGFYIPNRIGSMLSTLDVDRIEVLRGPQGTLFGKNSTGGLVNIVTKQPEDDFSADMTVRAGSYGDRSFKGSVNLPITDWAAARVAVAKETYDGHYYNTYFGQDWGARDLEAVSAQLRLKPTKNVTFDVGFRGNYQDDQQDGGGCRVYPDQGMLDTANAIATDLGRENPYTGPAYSNGVVQWGGGLTGNGHLEDLYPGATLDFWDACISDSEQGDYHFSSEKATFLKLDNEFKTASLAWESEGSVGILDELSAKLNYGNFFSSQHYLGERDYTPVMSHAAGTTPYGDGRARETESFEFLLSGSLMDRVDFVLGANTYDDVFYEGGGDCLRAVQNGDTAAIVAGDAFVDCKTDGNFQGLNLIGKPSGGGPGIAGRSGLISSEAVSFFADVTVNLTDLWALELGIRQTDEDRFFDQVEFEFDRQACSYASLPWGSPTDGPESQMCELDYGVGGTTNGVEFYNSRETSYSATTPRVSLKRKIGEDSIVYALYSEGFLSGGFNDELQDPILDPLVTYGPEKVKNYEIGVKGNFFDGRLNLAVDYFLMDYQDKQESIEIDNSSGQFGNEETIGLTTNAAAVEISGVEFEMRAMPWDGGVVALDFGYLKNEYTNYQTFDPATETYVDLTNTAINDYTPDLTINAMLQQDFTLKSGVLTGMIGVNWRDEYDYQSTTIDAPASRCIQDAYSTVRARATYRPDNANWQLAAYAKNLTDERYLNNCGFQERQGVYSYQYGAPRTLGLELKYFWD